MKRLALIFGFTLLLAGNYSCKNKNDRTTTDTTTTTTSPTAGPAEISDDTELRRGVTDATKDFPGVNASVENGVITLTGTIEKSRYMTLKQSLDGLHPKKVVNNLTYN